MLKCINLQASGDASMEQQLTIEKRFCGPPDSGNGGYVCGRLAAFVDSDAVAVRLLKPPPLEKGLAVSIGPAGAVLLDGDNRIAEARAVDFSLAAVESPGFAAAAAAAQNYRGFAAHPFPGCFVCGPDRAPDDGLCIFPGPVNSGELVAAPWVPHASLGNDEGHVRPEFLWAALDCPGAFSFPEPPGKLMLLGELQVRLSGVVQVGESCVLAGWELSHEGRKHITGTALYRENGACAGIGRGTWIEI